MNPRFTQPESDGLPRAWSITIFVFTAVCNKLKNSLSSYITYFETINFHLIFHLFSKPYNKYTSGPVFSWSASDLLDPKCENKGCLPNQGLIE